MVSVKCPQCSSKSERIGVGYYDDKSRFKCSVCGCIFDIDVEDYLDNDETSVFHSYVIEDGKYGPMGEVREYCVMEHPELRDIAYDPEVFNWTCYYWNFVKWMEHGNEGSYEELAEGYDYLLRDLAGIEIDEGLVDYLDSCLENDPDNFDVNHLLEWRKEIQNRYKSSKKKKITNKNTKGKKMNNTDSDFLKSHIMVVKPMPPTPAPKKTSKYTREQINNALVNFDDCYELFYNNGDYYMGSQREFGKLIERGDKYLHDYNEFINLMVSERHDLFTSDREVAALALALEISGIAKAPTEKKMVKKTVKPKTVKKTATPKAPVKKTSAPKKTVAKAPAKKTPVKKVIAPEVTVKKTVKPKTVKKTAAPAKKTSAPKKTVAKAPAKRKTVQTTLSVSKKKPKQKRRC